MNRLRPWCAPTALFLFVSCPVRAADPPTEKWHFDRAVEISPAAAPIPALKYRLYPSTADRKDGNAAPIYLRFAHERSEARKKQIQEKPKEWNALPLDKLPLAEVKQFLDSYKYNFKQLELGARRKTADWNYTLDAGDPIEMLLPDAQEMRMQAPLLVLKARAEMAEGRYADAVRTLETGFSFGEQVARGAFLVNGLVGIACSHLMADAALELVQRPGAPNLYWALTVLPRPSFELREAMEHEQRILEMEFPDLADVDRPRTPEQWDAVLARVRAHMDRLTELDKHFTKRKPGTGPSDPAANSSDLPAARKYLTEVVGFKADAVAAMPPAQVLILHTVHLYHELRDDMFKFAYLPFPETRAVSQAAQERLRNAPDVEAAWPAKLLLPAVHKVALAQVRMDRKIAALRVIEALRMHAAQTGHFPDRLDEVTAAPVPSDPGTGRPFDYERNQDKATLSSRLPGEPLELTGLRYRLTLRK